MTIQCKKSKNNRRGFTLVELAIVLAVTGVLFTGLYRLLSGGNAQVKDSSVASQQVQVINAVKGYLGSANGGMYMAHYASTTAAGSFTLPLPPSASAPNGTSNSACYAYMKSQDPTVSGTNPNGYLYTFCDALPAGYSTATLNAYGQSYLIRGETGIIPPITPAPAPGTTPPSTYSFMVMTTGGDIIPDADGGAISSQIGSDGGFIYTNPACTPTASTTAACGTYGGWQVANVTLPVANGGYGFPTSASGTVASRTFVSPETDSNQPWLARIFRPNDTPATATTSPNYNTMTTDLFLGNKNFWLANNVNAPNNPSSSSYNPAYPGFSSPSIHLQGGAVTLETGSITDYESNGNSIFLDAIYSPNGYLSEVSPNASKGPLATFNSRCTNVTGGVNGINYKSNCQFALSVGGDANVNGQLQAGVLYAGTFIYQSSDIRLKTNIRPIEHALDDVMRIKPVSFNFKADGQKGLGVIAQDIESVYPQLVIEKSNGMKSVNYDGLVAPLIESVQELKRENDDLRQQLKEQARREDKLESMLDSKK